MTILANAALTAITAPGTPDIYGNVTPGAPVWIGRAPCYLKRATDTDPTSRSTVPGGDSPPQSLTLTDEAFILATTGAPVVEVAGPDWSGTTVTILDMRARPYTARTYLVAEMENRAAGTIVDSVRLGLIAPSTT